MKYLRERLCKADACYRNRETEGEGSYAKRMCNPPAWDCGRLLGVKITRSPNLDKRGPVKSKKGENWAMSGFDEAGCVYTFHPQHCRSAISMLPIETPQAILSCLQVRAMLT